MSGLLCLALPRVPETGQQMKTAPCTARGCCLLLSLPPRQAAPVATGEEARREVASAWPSQLRTKPPLSEKNHVVPLYIHIRNTEK